MDEMFYNKHYITVDENGRITSGWSDGPFSLRDTSGAVLLNDKGGYQFRLYPDGAENPMLITEDGIPRYNWDGIAPVQRTEEEIEADRAARPAPAAELTVWDELEAAYQEGVNTAYDQ